MVISSILFCNIFWVSCNTFLTFERKKVTPQKSETTNYNYQLAKLNDIDKKICNKMGIGRESNVYKNIEKDIKKCSIKSKLKKILAFPLKMLKSLMISLLSERKI